MSPTVLRMHSNCGIALTSQGALYGAKALATGTGPILFAAMFAAFTKTDSPLPYFPGNDIPILKLDLTS